MKCGVKTSCGTGASCQSGRCVFHCTAEDACKTDPPLSCDASVCIAECSGKGSCDQGMTFNASTFCGITCSGSPSCNKGGNFLSCGASPDASIVCAKVMDACKDAKPSCRGGAYCNIECRDPSSCSVGYCCEAGTCIFDAAVPRTNSCP